MQDETANKVPSHFDENQPGQMADAVIMRPIVLHAQGLKIFI